MALMLDTYAKERWRYSSQAFSRYRIFELDSLF